MGSPLSAKGLQVHPEGQGNGSLFPHGSGQELGHGEGESVGSTDHLLQELRTRTTQRQNSQNGTPRAQQVTHRYRYTEIQNLL